MRVAIGLKELVHADLSGSLFGHLMSMSAFLLILALGGTRQIKRKGRDWTEITPKSSLCVEKNGMHGASLCLRVVLKGRPAALLCLHILASGHHLLAGYRTNQALP
jgi:hypothetical protein